MLPPLTERTDLGTWDGLIFSKKQSLHFNGVPGISEFLMLVLKPMHRVTLSLCIGFAESRRLQVRSPQLSVNLLPVD